MSICLNTEMCTGCGACVDTCLPQALCLMAGKVVMKPELCTACGDCVKACAMGAITIVEPPALMRPAEVPVPVTARAVQNTPQTQGKIVLWTGIAATLIEQQVLPRLADAFIAALDRRLSRPKPFPANRVGKDMEQSPSSGGIVQGNDGRGLTRRRRIRGDHSRG
jgi:NAD-dependent dihydropyrimidine dehydrogenase PreA subunit